MCKTLNKIYSKSKKIPIDEQTKIVVMSDCHRGAGDNFDNFIRNQNIFQAALLHYYKNGFTYVELGDGDEMWEVENYKEIVEEHFDTFQILKKFHDSNRLYMIYGNHDMCKKSKKILREFLNHYYNKNTQKEESLLLNLEVYESLILDYQNHEIFMVHGHQVDLLNSTFWRFSRFLVRHIWRHLEYFGIKDPTSTAKNYRVMNKVEKKLTKWSMEQNKILIAGHTHRPIYPKIGQSLYFNDGSCIHPNGITCLEIEQGKITLVKWQFTLKQEQYISVKREVLEGNEPILHFFK